MTKQELLNKLKADKATYTYWLCIMESEKDTRKHAKELIIRYTALVDYVNSMLTIVNFLEE